MHFLRTEVDKRLNAHETPHPAAIGQVDVMYCTRVPQSGNSGVFALCLNIRGILQKEQKSGRTATEKEKRHYWLQICNSKGGEVTVY